MIESLARELGDAVVTDPAQIAKLCEDFTEELPGRADAVVRARSVEDVRRVLAFSRERRVPVTPVVANTNVGGLAIPSAGGIILDLAGMNRILEINPREMYAVIEPGVTWEQIKARLAADHPELRFAYPLSPPDSSVMANALMDGLTTIGMRYGTTSTWVNGVEAVLADGTVARTGQGAFGGPWCSNAPLPDLTGLFLNWQGTTGIVTKMSIMVWPARKHRSRFLLPAPTAAAGCEFARRVAREEIADDVGMLGWGIVHMALSERAPLDKPPGDPELFLAVDVSSNFEDEFEARIRAVRSIARDVDAAMTDFVPAEDLGRLVPDLGRLLDLPQRLDFLLRSGLTWIGTYGPPSRWEEGIAKGGAAQRANGFPPAFVLRPFHLGHYGVLRLMATFDKKNPEECRRARAMNEAVLDAILPLGFVPYKTPPWAVKRVLDRMDPGFVGMIRRVKRAFDPEGLLNPGKWPV